MGDVVDLNFHFAALVECNANILQCPRSSKMALS